MAEQKNIIVSFNEKAITVLGNIESKYSLEENLEEAVKALRENKPFKINILVNLTRNLMVEKISNTGFLDALQKELKISKETTKNLALDIMDNLVPLLEKIPEDQLEEYNRKKSEVERKNEETETPKDEKEKLKEDLLEKLREHQNMPKEPEPEEPPPVPQVKKVTVEDVDKNAQKIQHIQQKEKPATPVEKVEQAPPDPYKEPIE